MAAIYPIDYPFNVSYEGWPRPVYAPPYPFEYYYDNGQSSQPIHTTSEFRNDHYNYYPSDARYKLPLTIRRHTPATSDMFLQSGSSSSRLPTITPRFTVNRTRSHPIRRVAPTDPDERPIRPMRDTSIYHAQSETKKPPKSKKPSPRFLEPMRTHSRPRPNPSPPPPPTRHLHSRPSISYPSNKTFPERRPIRTDLISRTPVDVTPRRTQPRRIIVEEYEDEDYHPVTYVKSLPRRVLPYRRLPQSTLHEYDEYDSPKVRRVVRVRSPPTERIIYHS